MLPCACIIRSVVSIKVMTLLLLDTWMFVLLSTLQGNSCTHTTLLLAVWTKHIVRWLTLCLELKQPCHNVQWPRADEFPEEGCSGVYLSSCQPVVFHPWLPDSALPLLHHVHIVTWQLPQQCWPHDYRQGIVYLKVHGTVKIWKGYFDLLLRSRNSFHEEHRINAVTTWWVNASSLTFKEMWSNYKENSAIYLSL